MGIREEFVESGMAFEKVDIFAPKIRLNAPHLPYEENAVSFRSALGTGKFPVGRDGDFYIDLGAGDEFVALYDKMKDAVLMEVAQSPELQALLKKEYWTLEERQHWEQSIADIAMEKTKILGEYRSSTPGQVGPLAAERSPRLNDLMIDIRNNTTHYEFDCEYMSAMRGMLIQHIEDHSLPLATPDSGGYYKQAYPYFYMTGYLKVTAEVDKRGGHAYIASTASSGIIEATNESNGMSYKKPVPLYSFADLVQGRPLSTIYEGSFQEYISDAPPKGYVPSKADADWRLDEALKAVDQTVAIVDEIKNNPGFKVLKAAYKEMSGPDFAASPETFERLAKLEELYKQSGLEALSDRLQEQAMVTTRLLADSMNSFGAYDGLSVSEKMERVGRVGVGLSRFMTVVDNVSSTTFNQYLKDDFRDTMKKISRLIDDYNVVQTAPGGEGDVIPPLKVPEPGAGALMPGA